MTQIDEIFLLKHGDLLQGIDKVLRTYKVAALTHKGERVLYDYVSNSREIEFDYKPTILSPKKFLFPQEETILEYTTDGKVSPKIKAEPLVMFGIRPCDLNGIKILDEAFADSNGDPNYLAKREQTVVIGIDCQKVCDEHAFCYKVEANAAKAGFDIMLYDLGSSYAVKSANEKGYKFIKGNFTVRAGILKDLEDFVAEKAINFSNKKPFKDLARLPEVFAQNKDHSVWKEEGDRCLSCGSCIMVCPTCYCFDMVDELSLDLKKGERLRRWDACMLRSFAVVVGGENFRRSAKNRLHHRISRKFDFLMRKHGQAVCVGCGRCVRACLAEISPKTIVEKITGEK